MNKLIFKLFDETPVFLLLALVTILISGCIPGITGRAVQAPNEITKAPEVYFCPAEDCGSVFEKNIEMANSSVHCALYDINLKNIIRVLSNRSSSIDVRIVMDSSNQKSQIKGDAVRADNDNQLMHNKFCVIDGYTVLTGSFNPTDNDNYKNNQHR